MNSPEIGPKSSPKIGDRSLLANYYAEVGSVPEGYEELMQQGAILELDLISIGSRFLIGDPITEDERSEALRKVQEILPKLEELKTRVNENKAALIGELIVTFTAFKKNPAIVQQS